MDIRSGLIQLSIITVILLSAESAQADSDRVRVSNADYSLTAAEEARLAELANEGDAAAAMRISDSYFYDTSNSAEASSQLALEWSLIAAENGSTPGEYRAFTLLGQSPQRPRQLRAMFWLNRAAEHGDPDAKSYLEDCPTIDSEFVPGAPCFGPNLKGRSQ